MAKLDKVEIFQDDSGEWRWHRQAGNNEIVSTSGEGFTSRAYAEESAYRYNNAEDVYFSLEPIRPTAE